jgi:hypothetical protein
VAAGGTFANYPSALLISFGTGGADWVYNLGTPVGNITGRFYSLLADDQWRVPFRTGSGLQLDGVTPWTLSAALTAASTTGVLQSVPGTPLLLQLHETVYGTVNTFGQFVMFGTAKQPLGDILALTDTGGGSVFMVDLGANAPPTRTALVGGVYGGVSSQVVPTSSATSAGTAGNPIMSLEAGRLVKITTLPASGSIADSKSLSVRGNNGALNQIRAWMRRLSDDL